MPFSRSHLYVPLVTEAGDLRRYAKVRIYLEDGKTPYAGKIYRDNQSIRTWPNPWIVSPALISVWLPEPMRVRLGISADQTKPEQLSDVYDVHPDGAETVTTVSPLYVDGRSTPRALLRGDGSGRAHWHPLRVDHEHEGIAANATRLGLTPLPLRQVETFPRSTTLGADSGGESARSSLNGATMLGLATDAYGRGTVAVGKGAFASEASYAPWKGGAVALGPDSVSQAESVALGPSSLASGPRSVALGWTASSREDDGISIGSYAQAGSGGIALGRGTGSTSRGNPGSIGLGAGAQYGLPGDLDPAHHAVLIGADDPASRRPFPWDNPDGSQSESPLREYTPAMRFTGQTVQIQRHLRWMINQALQVAKDATLGGKGGLLGFYGRTPVAKLSVGDDEPNSGIPALDSLIYALRDLGLLDFRTEAVTAYQAWDLLALYRNDDKVDRWPEHNGTDEATPVVATALPHYCTPDVDFNDYPSVSFDNGLYRVVTKPIQELRGKNLLEETKHFIVVSQHVRSTFGFYEGMLNLSGGETVVGDDTIFMSQTVGSVTWQMVNASAYYVDGLNQTANANAQLALMPNKLPAPHVYRMTNKTMWPHARPIIGGPRDQDAAHNWDNFSGAITEIVGMDDTWRENHVQSMEKGLAFKYRLAQNPSWLENPAANFIRTQHDPATGCYVFWNKDYPDNYTGRVYGKVIGCPKPVIFIPFCSIYIWFNYFSFKGSLLGNWGNLLGIDFAFNFQLEVSVAVGDFDGDGDFDSRVDIDYEFNSRFESHVGIFGLNNNFTWSMGNYGVYAGNKICRIRHRITREIVCMSGWPSSRYADTEVRIYSTKPDGSLLLESTSPLWGDGTFAVRVKNPGHKVARVYEKSTGNLLGTTEWQEKSLPRTQLYAADDPEVSTEVKDRAYVTPAALSAMAFLEMDNELWYRARHIIKSLALCANADGSLNEYYSASLPARRARPTGEIANVRGASWTILAVLRYWGASTDGQYLPFATALADWLNAQSIPLTADKAVAYFAFRDLAQATNEARFATAAQTLRTSLLNSAWSPTNQRFDRAAGDDREDLEADVLGGIFLLAVGERTRARALIRHLRRFRVKGATVSASHYAGPSQVIGYKPHAEFGTTPWPSPPPVIDQPMSWAAALFKTRFGEPIGDDVTSLMRWQGTAITGSGTSGLYGAQFLRYSGTATTSPYNLRARPHLLSAAWGYLLAKGSRRLLVPDNLPLPEPEPIPQPVRVRPVFDRNVWRVYFYYSWRLSISLRACAFEALPQVTFNGGITWTAIAQTSIVDQLVNVRDYSIGINGFSTYWSVPVPENRSAQYRVWLRLRHAEYGSWVLSETVSLPAIS